MKKILVCALFLGAISVSQAQEAEGRKIQAGLSIGAGATFNNVGTGKLLKNGAGSVFSIGPIVNFSFTDNIGLSTGLEFDFETLKYKTGNDPVFYKYDDKKIIQGEDNKWATSKVFLLEERKQKPVYLTIPTMAIFRTNFIGYFRYFGKFGLRSSFLLGNSSVDKGRTGILLKDEVEQKGMKADADMFFFKSSVGISGGAEWNFTGSTTLVAEIGYFYGFINMYRNHVSNVGSDKESKPRPTLYTLNLDNGVDFFSNKVTQGQFRFKVSVLF